MYKHRHVYPCMEDLWKVSQKQLSFEKRTKVRAWVGAGHFFFLSLSNYLSFWDLMPWTCMTFSSKQANKMTPLNPNTKTRIAENSKIPSSAPADSQLPSAAMGPWPHFSQSGKAHLPMRRRRWSNSSLALIRNI